MRKLVPLLALAAVAYAAPFGCSKPAPSTVSNVAGTLALESFPSAVHRITVVDKSGQKTRVAVGKDGSFSVPLAAGKQLSPVPLGRRQRAAHGSLQPRRKARRDRPRGLRRRQGERR